jgi:AcrR family transcriptional regulator
MLKPVQTRMKPEDRERQLLEVAQRMFVERGYQGTAMEDIARAAGVTRPVVYKLFGNKDGIYLACLKIARELLNSYIIEHALKGDGLQGRLRGGIEGYFSFVEVERDAFRFLYDSGAAVAGPAAQAAGQLRFDTVNRIALLLGDLKGIVSEEEIVASPRPVGRRRTTGQVVADSTPLAQSHGGEHHVQSALGGVGSTSKIMLRVQDCWRNRSR